MHCYCGNCLTPLLLVSEALKLNEETGTKQNSVAWKKILKTCNQHKLWQDTKSPVESGRCIQKRSSVSLCPFRITWRIRLWFTAESFGLSSDHRAPYLDFRVDIKWRQRVHTNGGDYRTVLWLQFHLSTWVRWGLPCPPKVLTGYLISILGSDFGAATSSTEPLSWVDIHLQHFHDPLVSPGAIHKLIKRELPCVQQREALKLFHFQNMFFLQRTTFISSGIAPKACKICFTGHSLKTANIFYHIPIF